MLSRDATKFLHGGELCVSTYANLKWMKAKRFSEFCDAVPIVLKSAGQDEVVGDWSHWVFTKNAATGEMKIYQNGLLWHSDAGKTTPIPGADCSHLWLGKRPIVTENTYPFYGMMDEFRIYDYELSEAEVLSLAGVSGLYFPLTSEANLYDEEPQNSKSINFNDLAVLAEDWLETRLWPPR